MWNELLWFRVGSVTGCECCTSAGESCYRVSTAVTEVLCCSCQAARSVML